MTTTAPSIRSGAERRPRRLPYEARRAQLVGFAAPIVADQGLTEFSLDAVAAQANVTRNLLYHYFPRGRRDIVLAVADWAGCQLTAGWIVDESVPLTERVAGNFQRFLNHAIEPSVAWRLNRIARSAGDPEIDELIDGFHEAIVSSVALNQLGTPDPPAMVHIAIKAFIAFGESLLDQAREQGIPPERSLQLMAHSLASSIQAGVAASQ